MSKKETKSLLARILKLISTNDRKLKIMCEDTDERFNFAKDNEYGRYLQSRHWSNVKGVAYLYCKGRCVCCGKKVGINGWIGHHCSTSAYSRLGRERKGDVLVVCTNCHNGRSREHILLHKNIDVPPFAKIKKVR